MPELPEVEATRRLLIKYARGKRVSQALPEDDPKVFCGADRGAITAAFSGRRIADVGRLGKYFFLQFDDFSEGPPVIMHLGMTGQVWVRTASKGGEVDTVAYARDVGNGKQEGGGGSNDGDGNPRASSWPPRFCKLELELEDRTRLAYCDARRFGRIQLLPAGANPLQLPPLSKLGFDPLVSMPPPAQFAALLAARRSAKLKPLLLDQAFSAGVGNWVADEVLWQSRLHPEQRVAELLEADEGGGGGGGGGSGNTHVARLHAALRDVCALACQVDADSTLFPEGWLFPYRWTGGKSTRMPDGAGGHYRVEFLTSGGRTSAYVPALQKMVSSSAGAGGGGKGGKGGGTKSKKREEEEEEEEEEEDEEQEEEKPRRPAKKAASAPASKKQRRQKQEEEEEDVDGQVSRGARRQTQQQKQQQQQQQQQQQPPDPPLPRLLLTTAAASLDDNDNRASALAPPPLPTVARSDTSRRWTTKTTNTMETSRRGPLPLLLPRLLFAGRRRATAPPLFAARAAAAALCATAATVAW
jgi:formamidopyrimidine-DNA glycosylase